MLDSLSENFNILDSTATENSLQALDSSSLIPETAYGLETSTPTDTSSSLLPVENLETGIFTVGESGEVTFDYLFDGGSFEGELAIFNIEGMDLYGGGSKIFLQEAALRALQNSPEWGHVITSDATEGAKFSGVTQYEGDFNKGEYLGSKTFEMTPGTRFGVMLVPDSTVQDTLVNPDLDSKNRPLFSLAPANPDEENYFVQLVEVNPSDLQQIDGNSFGIEDVRLDGTSDRDYNDVTFQVRGANGEAPLLDELINPEKDWRTSEVGEKIIDYVTLDGKGLTAEYYDNIDFTAYRGRRTDASVNNNWGLEAPEVMTSPDTFSIRWTGQIEPLYSENYTFYTNSDERVRLYVNGQLIIDNFEDHTLTEDSASITLEAGQKYDIKIEYVENTGEAAIKLLWSSTSQPKEVIPQNVLYPNPDALPIDLETGLEYAPDELLVKFNSGLSDEEIREIAKENGAIEVERLVPLRTLQSPSELDKWRVLYFAPKTDMLAIRSTITENTNIESVELDYALEDDDALPNDPDPEIKLLDNKLWGLKKINAPKAWNFQRGSKDVVVAVIDSGVDYTHPDLKDNMWRNLGEVETPNGIDDDGNGFVDDIFGYDFGDKDGDPSEGNGHGTKVAGTIGAVHNKQGVAGVSPNVSIMALKRKSSSGLIKNNLKYTLRAIDYAVSEGADIINASFGSKINFWRTVGGFFGVVPTFGSAIDAVRRANDAEILLVASAGNDGENIDGIKRFPSTLDLPNVITVAATDRNDQLASFSNGKASNYGAAKVDIGAPGDDSISTSPGGGYSSGWNGTSMAAPYVAGAAALLLAEDPFLRASELRDILMRSADPVPALSGKTVIGGRLNVYNALSKLKPTRRLKLVINELKDIGKMDEGTDTGIFGIVGASPADFYARVNIDGQKFDDTQDISNTSNPRPNWTFIKPIDVTASGVDLSIEIWDSDDGLNGDPDIADVNPFPESYILNLTYDLDTKQVINRDTGIRYSRLDDGRFYFTGDNKDDQTDIWFTLDVSA